MKRFIAAFGLVVGLTSFLLGVAPAALGGPEYDAAANAAFLRLLDERGMLPAPGIYNERGITVQQELVETAQFVCTITDLGKGYDAVMRYLYASQPNQTDMWYTVFAALAVRTFCPATPADRSW